MKYIKLFENYNNIEAICKKYKIENYTINEDETIDVNGDVNLRNYSLSKISLNFNNVIGYFDCSGNKLSSLEGCPKHVGSGFYCGINELTTLKYCPKYIGGVFYCEHNQLKTIEGCLKNINNTFYCNDNKLTTLKYFPKVRGDIFIDRNPLPKRIYANEEYIKEIIKNQYDYKIWNKDDTLNLSRFNIMIEEIKYNNQ